MSFSTDQPRRDPRRRMGKLKARLTAHLYQVDYGRGSEWAYYPGDDLLTLGTDRTTVFDPASEQWWIRPLGDLYDVVVGADQFSTNRVGAWMWMDGFGAPYAQPPNEPTTTVYGTGVGASDVAVTGDAGNVETFVWPWTHGVGFGPKYSNPATLLDGSQGFDVAFCGNGSVDTDIAYAHGSNSTRNITAYPWVTGVGFGTKYADPATVPADDGFSIKFLNSAEVAIAHNLSPYISVYPWTPGAGFGVKYSNPATLMTSTGYSVDWAGTADIAIGQSGSPYISAYPWSPGSGFGAKYSNPASLPSSSSNSIVFMGVTDIVLANSSSPYVTAYPWASGSGFGVKYSNPASIPTLAMYGVDKVGSSAVVVVGDYTFVPGEQPIFAYPWTSGTGFGARYTNPASPVMDSTVGGVSVWAGA